jgi:hypothetical protein
MNAALGIHVIVSIHDHEYFPKVNYSFPSFSVPFRATPVLPFNASNLDLAITTPFSFTQTFHSIQMNVFHKHLCLGLSVKARTDIAEIKMTRDSNAISLEMVNGDGPMSRTVIRPSSMMLIRFMGGFDGWIRK